METLSQVIARLQAEGYTGQIPTEDIHTYNPNEWKIDEIFRFEGKSNPEDNSILYALTPTHESEKVLITNGYGIYEDMRINEFIKRVQDCSKEDC